MSNKSDNWASDYPRGLLVKDMIVSCNGETIQNVVKNPLKMCDKWKKTVLTIAHVLVGFVYSYFLPKFNDIFPRNFPAYFQRRLQKR